MQKKLVITIDEDKVASMPEIANELLKKGMYIEKTYSYGVIIGSGDESITPDIKAIDGIEDVQPESSIQLPPNDADIQ